MTRSKNDGVEFPALAMVIPSAAPLVHAFGMTARVA
jgi:hypothetical protein